MKPEDIGRPSNKLVLGKHSGRAALGSRLRELGFDLQPPEIDRAFKKFKTSRTARRRSTTRTS
jgi:2-isopropylmalate synthase